MLLCECGCPKLPEKHPSYDVQFEMKNFLRIFAGITERINGRQMTDTERIQLRHCSLELMKSLSFTLRSFCSTNVGIFFADKSTSAPNHDFELVNFTGSATDKRVFEFFSSNFDAMEKAVDEGFAEVDKHADPKPEFVTVLIDNSDHLHCLKPPRQRNEKFKKTVEDMYLRDLISKHCSLSLRNMDHETYRSYSDKFVLTLKESIAAFAMNSYPGASVSFDISVKRNPKMSAGNFRKSVFSVRGEILQQSSAFDFRCGVKGCAFNTVGAARKIVAVLDHIYTSGCSSHPSFSISVVCGSCSQPRAHQFPYQLQDLSSSSLFFGFYVQECMEQLLKFVVAHSCPPSSSQPQKHRLVAFPHPAAENSSSNASHLRNGFEGPQKRPRLDVPTSYSQQAETSRPSTSQSQTEAPVNSVPVIPMSTASCSTSSHQQQATVNSSAVPSIPSPVDSTASSTLSSDVQSISTPTEKSLDISEAYKNLVQTVKESLPKGKLPGTADSPINIDIDVDDEEETLRPLTSNSVHSKNLDPLTLATGRLKAAEKKKRSDSVIWIDVDKLNSPPEHRQNSSGLKSYPLPKLPEKPSNSSSFIHCKSCGQTFPKSPHAVTNHQWFCLEGHHSKSANNQLSCPRCSLVFSSVFCLNEHKTFSCVVPDSQAASTCTSTLPN